MYVNRKKVLKKASPKIQVLKVACSRGKTNTELVDLSNRGHHVLLQTFGASALIPVLSVLSAIKAAADQMYVNVCKSAGPLQ